MCMPGAMTQRGQPGTVRFITIHVPTGKGNCFTPAFAMACAEFGAECRHTRGANLTERAVRCAPPRALMSCRQLGCLLEHEAEEGDAVHVRQVHLGQGPVHRGGEQTLNMVVAARNIGAEQLQILPGAAPAMANAGACPRPAHTSAPNGRWRCGRPRCPARPPCAQGCNASRRSANASERPTARPHRQSDAVNSFGVAPIDAIITCLRLPRGRADELPKSTFLSCRQIPGLLLQRGR